MSEGFVLTICIYKCICLELIYTCGEVNDTVLPNSNLNRRSLPRFGVDSINDCMHADKNIDVRYLFNEQFFLRCSVYFTLNTLNIRI